MRGVNRQTVDLSKYPDLVVIYLGMRMNMLRGLKTMIGFGPQIQQSVDAKPEGLLLHESLLFSLFPSTLFTSLPSIFKSLNRSFNLGSPT